MPVAAHSFALGGPGWEWWCTPHPFEQTYTLRLAVGERWVRAHMRQEEVEDDWLPEVITWMARQMRRNLALTSPWPWPSAPGEVVDGRPAG